jgi:hypothetical protein
MRYAIVIMGLLALTAMAGYDLGLGFTAVTEEQSAADYGWTATLGSSVELLGIDWGTRLMGTVTYPEYSHQYAVTGEVLGTAGYMIDEEFGMEAGAGIEYGNEIARTMDDEEWVPIIYYGWIFELDSGHDIRPFVEFSLNDRETVQAGFLVTFGR